MRVNTPNAVNNSMKYKNNKNTLTFEDLPFISGCQSSLGLLRWLGNRAVLMPSRKSGFLTKFVAVLGKFVGMRLLSEFDPPPNSMDCSTACMVLNWFGFLNFRIPVYF